MAAMFRSLALLLVIGGCSPTSAESFQVTGSAGTRVEARVITEFDEPWAMTFLPGGGLLVTTKPGKLFLLGQDGTRSEVEGIWDVAYGGQGGLGDVVPHPEFEANGLLYISSVEAEGGKRGAVVRRARLERSESRVRLTGIETIWTQVPKVGGSGHFSHRLAFGPDGMLYVTSGDRQKLAPAQDLDKALGKIIRIKEDGSVPDGNPWQDKGELARTFWSMGHRNPLGIAFDSEGRLWSHEMGPAGGDELNLIRRGGNYGWPIVSNGDHYSGEPIPDHGTRPEYDAPRAFWNPSISPAGLAIYDGALFPLWQGNLLIAALSGQVLLRLSVEGETASEAERFAWDRRLREVEVAPDGAVWVLEDQDGGRLLRLAPG
jgi:glucose/arabinose dehydrogenase